MSLTTAAPPSSVRSLAGSPSAPTQVAEEDLTPDVVLDHARRLSTQVLATVCPDPNDVVDLARTFRLLDVLLRQGAAVPRQWLEEPSLLLLGDIDFVGAESSVQGAAAAPGGGISFPPLPATVAGLEVPRKRRAPKGTPNFGSPAYAGTPAEGLSHGSWVPPSNNGQPTSVAVAQKMALKAGRLNHEVFWLIYRASAGMADHELEAKMGRTHQSVSATRNTLMNKGYVHALGETRLTPAGNEALVWTPTPWATARVTAGLEIPPE